MSANELSALLWKERELLELLQFKLEEEQLLLVSGKSRWIGMATREVETVLEKVHAIGLTRSIEAASVAAAWGLPGDAPLADIAAQAPQGPWTDILAAHLTALREITTQIATLREDNEQYLRAAHRSTQETLATLDDERPGYDKSGTGATARVGARIIDTSL